LPEEDDRDLGRQLEGALTCLKNRVTLEEARHLTRKIEEGGDSNLLAAIQARFRTLKGGSGEGGSSEGEAVR